MVTQKDIANKLGVSRQLVGHALQGRPNVSPKTKKLIIDVAKDMGYHPEANWAARVMLAKRHETSGQVAPENNADPEESIALPVHLIVRRVSSASDTNNMLFIDYFNGFIEAFSEWKRGLELTCPLPDRTDLDVVRDIVETGRGSGIISFTHQSHQAMEYLIKKQFPTIILNEDLTSEGIASVIADHVSGYAEAWRSVAQMGHRTVAFVGYCDCCYEGKNFAPRLQECDAGAAEAKINFRIGHRIQISANSDKQETWNIFAAKCGTDPDDSRWPTLAFAQNDICAQSLISALQTHGIRVPQDISVIGFDDSPVAKYINPPLATLSKQRFEMARAGVKLLRDVLRGQKGSRQRLQVFPVRFIQRESLSAATKA